MAPSTFSSGAIDNHIHHERNTIMGKKVDANHRTESSSYIDSEDSSSSDEQVKRRDSAQGDYAEGRVTPATNSNTTERNFIHICPSTVRLAVGVFCGLTAVAGMALAIVGGNALNSPTDPEPNLHRAMFGSGGAMIGLGFLGMLATQLTRANPAPSNATA
ncbi:MAG: hypothetical protein EBZ75_06885 [Oxalobacteraceae bacterium]|nr:hypothetical protein [Oxalobacteraceae bacterium]